MSNPLHESLRLEQARMARQSEDGKAEAEVLRTLVDQAIYGHARLSAGSPAIWAEVSLTADVELSPFCSKR